MMVRNGSGFIVNISSAGGLRYLFNVPYGVGKQALDRMASDMAEELKKKNVCMVSIWPGAVRTEFITNVITEKKKDKVLTLQKFANFTRVSEIVSPKYESGFSQVTEMFERGETPEYPGKAIVALASDGRRMEKTGRILITEDLGKEYGFKDIDGREPPNLRSITFLLLHSGHNQLAQWVPSWLKVPGWFLWGSASRL
uniref:Dehydrogenase/reductase SDR family member 1 n=1 Tax=Angiostrongylus cantonensis TaxID=6313 RepID=A0A0K0DG43_ANGCA